jgi:HAD superfamily hydrolase (TIGR01549 family)
MEHVMKGPSAAGSELPDAVLFDLDGTLISTKSLYLEAYRCAVEPYVREGLTRQQIMALKPTSELAFIRAVVAAPDVDACVEDFHRAYRDLHEGMFEGVFPGVMELLESLRSANVALGVVSGKSRRSWEVTSGIVTLGLFDVLVFDDDVRAPKPDPHGLELALSSLGVTAGRAIYVGDTVTDVRAARGAGVPAVTVTWARPETERSALRRQALDAGAAAVVERPAELGGLLGLSMRPRTRGGVGPRPTPPASP